jgi:hypothetical protein
MKYLRDLERTRVPRKPLDQVLFPDLSLLAVPVEHIQPEIRLYPTNRQEAPMELMDDKRAVTIESAGHR